MTRVIRLLTVVLLGLVASARMAAADLSSHCRGHHEQSHHSAPAQHQDPGSESDCPHCPASSCAVVAPCTSSPAPATVSGFTELRVESIERPLTRLIQIFASRSPQPALPPPRV